MSSNSVQHRRWLLATYAVGVVVQCSPQLEEMERFAEEVIPLVA